MIGRSMEENAEAQRQGNRPMPPVTAWNVVSSRSGIGVRFTVLFGARPTDLGCRMSQCTRNLEIIAADFGYTYGSIDFAVRPGYKRYRYSFNNNEGRTICDLEWDGKAFSPTNKPRRVTDDELVAIIGDKHWNLSDFIAVWQGWASGYERGKNDGRYAAGHAA